MCVCVCVCAWIYTGAYIVGKRENFWNGFFVLHLILLRGSPPPVRFPKRCDGWIFLVGCEFFLSIFTCCLIFPLLFVIFLFNLWDFCVGFRLLAVATIFYFFSCFCFGGCRYLHHLPSWRATHKHTHTQDVRDRTSISHTHARARARALSLSLHM